MQRRVFGRPHPKLMEVGVARMSQAGLRVRVAAAINRHTLLIGASKKDGPLFWEVICSHYGDILQMLLLAVPEEFPWRRTAVKLAHLYETTFESCPAA